MYRGSRPLGKIRLHFPAHKVPLLECGTRLQAQSHLVTEFVTSKSGGTISQLGWSTSVACNGSPRKQQLHVSAIVNSAIIRLDTNVRETIQYSGPGSSVGIATELRLGRSGDRIPVGARFSAPVQTGTGAHPASCTMGTGSFPGVESGQGLTLTPHPLLMPRSKNRVELYLYCP
jgi:hypothetical protein